MKKRTLPLPCSPLANAPRSLPTQCPGAQSKLTGQEQTAWIWVLAAGQVCEEGADSWGVVGEMPPAWEARQDQCHSVS